MTHVLIRLAAVVALCTGPLFPVFPADEPALKPFDASSPHKIRRALDGRAFLLVFWSLYCDPCREEMAQWGELQRKHPDVPIVLVATDAAEERSNVAKFLRQHQLGRVETWMFADEFVERIRYAVDPGWRGELPRTYFLDAAHRAKAHSGRVDSAAVSGWMAAQRRDARSRQPPPR
jgi:thiol-disulfide isomerase/thioredoxin